MKKINILALIALFILPVIKVKAATTPTVLTLEATTSGTNISYNGTIEEGSTAVMCKLLNNNREEIDLLSSQVEDNNFSGTFTVTTKTDYKIACANYEGGEIKEVNVSFEETKDTTEEEKNTTNNTKPSNVKTGDNILIFIALAVVSLIGITTTIIINKKRIIRVR